VPAGAKITALVKDGGDIAETRMARHQDLILRLARLETITPSQEIPKGSAQAVIDGATVVLPLESVIDIEAEVARLKKAVGKAEGEITGIDKKLSNEKFLANAPDEVVEEQRERRAAAVETRDRLKEAVARLEA